MIYLVLSDIHANREALEAVARETTGRYERLLCLGDVVGYGPDPAFAIDWLVAQSDCTIVRGNHDKAAAGLSDLDNFNPIARKGAEWTARALDGAHQTWLRGLPRGPLVVEDFHICHGSPRDEDEYLSLPQEAARLLSNPYGEPMPLVTFFGHTHQQGGFTGPREFPARPTHRLASAIGRNEPVTLTLDFAPRYLINPGAVGQPRDGDPRAAYAYYDSASRVVTYHRVAYDVAATQRKVLAAGLPVRLAERLAHGR